MTGPDETNRDRLGFDLRKDFKSLSFSETYCGGYSGEDPPLPIPNREVKLTSADGTAIPSGRVGSRHFLRVDCFSVDSFFIFNLKDLLSLKLY